MKNRYMLFSFVLFSMVTVAGCLAHTSIHDVSQLATGQVRAVVAPASINELRNIIKNSKRPIAIAGGRFSQGGHIWCNDGMVIDMTRLNQILALDKKRKTITVRAGATWEQIQHAIDPYGLSIAVMQSYNNFTVGGSLSINVHGRTLDKGALIETVESIQLMLADGSMVKASRTENYDLFKAAIGGYGAIGIIIEATLFLADNEAIAQQEVIMPLSHYADYFSTMVKSNPSVVFHNANIYTDDFNKISSITWYKTEKPCTIADRLQSNQLFTSEHFGFQLARYIRGMQKIRLPFGVMKNPEKVVWRNYEMSTSVATVEPLTRLISTTVLQEYFVPCDKLSAFVEQLKNVVTKYDVNMMNVSIRYVHRDTESVMAYAQAPESFALVCYINMRNNASGMRKAEQWTQELIDHIIALGGTYYLPYQLHATKQQFDVIYPRAKELLAIKKKVDPNFRFMNSFLQKYIV